ncbi:MAG: hypothetical protein RL745_661 [Actinomycetota bacterium]
MRFERTKPAVLAVLLCVTIALSSCARRSGEPNPTGSSATDSASITPSNSSSESASPTSSDEGTPISSEQLQSIISNTRQGLGASVGIEAAITGALDRDQSFIGTVDVDSGTAEGQVAVGTTASRDRIIVDSTVYTRTLKKWVAVSIDGQGVPEGDVLLLWSVLSQTTDAHEKTGDGGRTITGTLPASMFLQALGTSGRADVANTNQQFTAAAKGANAQVELVTDADGFISHVTITSTLNVNGTPTTLSLHAMFSDYGQVMDVRKPVTGPLYTPEGQ